MSAPCPALRNTASFCENDDFESESRAKRIVNQNGVFD
jgi:hypothetical protein